MMIFKSTWLWVILSAFPTWAVAAQDSPVPLSTIIQRVIARDDANQKELQTMEYRENLLSEQLGADGHVTKHSDVQMLIRPGAADEVVVLSSRGDDIPGNPDDAARKAKGDETKRRQLRFALKDMAQRFTITLAAPGVFEGQAVYVLAFEPKPGQSYQNQTEKVLNRLHGKMWVSTADYSVLKTEASLAEPVEVAWFLAQITTLNFHYELRNTTGGMGPAFVQTSVVVKAPFVTVRQQMKVDMFQFRKRAPSVAGN